MEHAGSLESTKEAFYNIADGIVHQNRREKRTTISEVIVRGNRSEILSKIELSFISISLLKVAVLFYCS